MIWWILIGILVAIFSWLLVAPMQLIIDSRSNNYSVYWRGIGRVSIVERLNTLWLDISVFFWQKRVNVFAIKGRKKTESKPKTKSTLQDTRKQLRRIKRLIRSFKVRQLSLLLDTDDYLLNSYLIPFFTFINGDNTKVAINYRGDNELQLVVENRLYRIIKALI